MDVFDQNKIANKFNISLGKIGPKLASSIRHNFNNFQKFVTA